MAAINAILGLRSGKLRVEVGAQGNKASRDQGFLFPTLF